jgi:hypothetical protein
MSWDLEMLPAGDTVWYTVETNILTLDKLVTGLDGTKQYEFKGTVRIISDVTARVSSITLEAPTRVLQYRDTFPAHAMNAMFIDREPSESGVSGIPVIASPGRTIISNFNRIMLSTQAAQHRVFGVRFRLGNMTTQPISGGKMIVGWSNGWNGQWYPRVNGVNNNALTENWLNGWQRVSVGGDYSLPIPAADPGIWPLRTVWTDPLIAPSGFLLNTAGLDIMTRFLLPPRSVAPYAITNGSWGTQGFERMGVLAGRSLYLNEWRLLENTPRDYHGRWEGDGVTTPLTADQMVGVGFNDAGTSPITSKYGPPGPVHSPLLEIQYATSLEEALSWQ